MSKNSITFDQHYIPRKFLNAWCGKDGFLFAKRYNETVFQTKPEGVAFEKKMYEFKPIDREMFKTMIGDAKKSHYANGQIPTFFKKVILLNAFATIGHSIIHLKKLDANSKSIITDCRQEGIIDNETDETFKLIEYYDAQHLEMPVEINDMFSKFLTEGHEPLMCAVESDFWPILDGARQGQLSLPLSYNEIERFITYVITQLFRTPKYFNVLKGKTPALLPMASYLQSKTIMNCIVGMMTHRQEDELQIINNASELPFLTGDQPLFNLLSYSEKPLYFDIFFPISPDKAFFYAKKGRLDKNYPWLKVPGVREVHCLNQELCKNCSQFVFARDEETLIIGGYAVPHQ